MQIASRLASSSHQLGPLLQRLVLAVCVLATSPTQADSTEFFHPASPTWLRAVGKLHVPGVKYKGGHQLNHRENCSATLVARPGQKKEAGANTIITAWHCLEFYNDLSKTITFTLLYGTAKSFSTEAYRLADGGGLGADWAVMRLIDAVPASRVSALAIHPDRADRQRPIIMAGYSKNSPGERLSYDPHCSITFPFSPGKGTSESNCKALKGASGGAVVQLSTEGEPLLAGVISQGNSHDLSLFVPVGTFRSAIQASLR